MLTFKMGHFKNRPSMIDSKIALKGSRRDISRYHRNSKMDHSFWGWRLSRERCRSPKMAQFPFRQLIGHSGPFWGQSCNT